MKLHWSLFVAAALCAALVGQARAAIVTSGDVDPADPATWTSSTNAYIGYSGSGEMTVDAGSDVVLRSGRVGYRAGSTGAATVDGAGSRWEVIFLDVGYSGAGTLDISDGGAVDNSHGTIGTAAGSTGTATVDGAGSVWETVFLTVGGSGEGALDISNGGTVSNNIGRLGYSAGSTGTATVSGPSSAWNNTFSLDIGIGGEGTLNIVNGGIVTVTGTTTVSDGASAAGRIVFDNGTLTTGTLRGLLTDLAGTGTINTAGLISDVDLVFDSTHGTSRSFTLNGPGQNIVVNLDANGDGDMGIGYVSNGTMSIADGVTVRSARGYVGYRAGLTGVVTIDGAGSAWVDARLYVGNYGTGTLDITNGGIADSSFGYLGYYAGSTGAATVDGAGSAWESSFLHVGESGAGTLDITNGGAVGSSFGYLGNRAGSTGDVTVSGMGSTWTNGGNLDVGGLGVGVLTLEDGGMASVGMNLFVSGASSIEFGLSGRDVESRLTVTRLATLDGSLTVFAMDGFAPLKGMTFDLFDWNGGVSGEFAGIFLPILASEFWSWDTSNIYSTGEITVVPEPATMSLLALGVCLSLFRRKRR